MLSIFWFKNFLSTFILLLDVPVPKKLNSHHYVAIIPTNCGLLFYEERAYFEVRFYVRAGYEFRNLKATTDS